MSDIDLTEATEAAARALACLETGEDWPSNYDLGGNVTGTRDDEFRDGMLDQAADAVLAAAPLIEAQVRAQIAADLNDVAEGYSPMSHDRGVFSAAARIARGES